MAEMIFLTPSCGGIAKPQGGQFRFFGLFRQLFAESYSKRGVFHAQPAAHHCAQRPGFLNRAYETL
jgi:hypothetical protein